MRKIKPFFILITILFIIVILCFFCDTRFKDVKSDIKQETSITKTSYEYTSNIQGYSLNLPNTYKVLAASQNQTEFAYSSSNPDDGLSWIDTEPANGRTLDYIVQEVIKDQGGILDIKTKAVTIDGERAVVIGPLSGQNYIRRIIVIHNDTLYQMNFTPEDPNMGDFYKHMEDLYSSVINTFRFTN